ncbi:MAG: sulfatase [Phycisphaeraceae bacterium]
MTPRQPNILFILIDDMGWRDLACYGSSFYETPHIDRLAAQGMTFTDAYAACPVCSPTRASILTGKYPARVGITNWIPGNPWGKLMGVPFFDRLPETETTVAQALRDGGYHRWHVGKWHLGPKGHWPEDFGFDVNVAGCDWGSPHKGYFSPYSMANLDDGPEGEYLTDRLTEEAIALIRERDAGRPFFLHLSHYAVHTPIQAPAELVAKYERKAKALGLEQLDALEPGDAFPCLHKKDQRIMRRRIQSHPVYAAMVENLDTNVGRLLDALDEQGLADETLVVFTSDNGGLSTAEGSPTCNAPLAEGKGWMYDGGVREPLLVRWPGVVEPGATCEVPVTSTDFYPTFLEAAGLPLRPDQHADGVSLLPLLRGEGAPDRAGIFWHYPHYSNQGGTPACAVRAGDWKLIEFFEDARLELYNLRDDLEEQHDRAADEPARVTELHGKLVAWRESIEAKIPEPNPDYAAMMAGSLPCPDGRGHIPGDDRAPT